MHLFRNAIILFFPFFHTLLSQSNSSRTTTTTINPAEWPTKDVVTTIPRQEWGVVPSFPPDTSTTMDFAHCSSGMNDWALTFDDGPSEYTPIVLDALRERNIKATFFIVGSRVLDRPALLKRIYDEGHQIAIHTWSHQNLTNLTSEQIVNEILYTAEIIRRVIGVVPRVFRPPYGDADPRVRGIIHGLGLFNVIWNRDTFDWRTNTTGESLAASFEQFHNNPSAPSALTNLPRTGGIITLEHDLYPHSARAAPSGMDVIRRRGTFRLRTIDQCINQPAYDTTNGSSEESGRISSLLDGNSVAIVVSSRTLTGTRPTATPTQRPLGSVSDTSSSPTPAGSSSSQTPSSSSGPTGAPRSSNHATSLQSTSLSLLFTFLFGMTPILAFF